MTKEDDKYRQGRSKKQYESSTKGAMISYIGCTILGIYAIIKWLMGW